MLHYESINCGYLYNIKNNINRDHKVYFKSYQRYQMLYVMNLYKNTNKQTKVK